MTQEQGGFGPLLFLFIFTLDIILRKTYNRNTSKQEMVT